MPKLLDTSPRVSLRLYKTISRSTIDGQSAVSTRYQGKDEYIDLTPFLNLGSSVRTSKSVREPAGGFSIGFADKPQSSMAASMGLPLSQLESVYGLVEPMDMIEIRMSGGSGASLGELPIIMRGFVSNVSRKQTMGDDGRPQRQVIVTGQDYGKIWQTFQVIHLAAYAERQGLLTSFALWEMFGMKAVAAMKAGEFVRTMVEKVINPHLDKFIPKNSPMPRKILTGDSIAVKHGMVSNSYQNTQGSIYDILKFHGDVGVWNELYTEDREDGVHCVYRPIPALHLTQPKGAKDRKIMDDAPDPIYCVVPDSIVKDSSVARSDGNVANFYWVNNTKFDLIDDIQRKLASIPADDGKVSLKEYPNTAVKYYGVRAMYAETQQYEDGVANTSSGQEEGEQTARGVKLEAWIDRRRRNMLEMNRDNVVLERGTVLIKGGVMRPDGMECMKAGDYARFLVGQTTWDAYVVQIDHDFQAFQSYTATLTLERGDGFAKRTAEFSSSSPWLAEQASRGGLL